LHIHNPRELLNDLEKIYNTIIRVDGSN